MAGFEDNILATQREIDKMPTATRSEQEMAKDASAAVRFAKRHDALDLLEMLGISEFEGTVAP